MENKKKKKTVKKQLKHYTTKTAEAYWRSVCARQYHFPFPIATASTVQSTSGQLVPVGELQLSRFMSLLLKIRFVCTTFPFYSPLR